MALCLACGAQDLAPGEVLCLQHSARRPNWARDNAAMCDFLHRKQVSSIPAESRRTAASAPTVDSRHTGKPNRPGAIPRLLERLDGLREFARSLRTRLVAEKQGR